MLIPTVRCQLELSDKQKQCICDAIKAVDTRVNTARSASDAANQEVDAAEKACKRAVDKLAWIKQWYEFLKTGLQAQVSKQRDDLKTLKGLSDPAKNQCEVWFYLLAGTPHEVRLRHCRRVLARRHQRRHLPRVLALGLLRAGVEHCRRHLQRGGRGREAEEERARTGEEERRRPRQARERGRDQAARMDPQGNQVQGLLRAALRSVPTRNHREPGKARVALSKEPPG